MDQNTIAPNWLRPLLPTQWEEINATSSNTKANILFRNPMYSDINEQDSKEIYNEELASSSTCLIDGDAVFEKEVEEKKESHFQKVLQPTFRKENAFGFELLRKYSSCLGDKGWFSVTFRFSMNFHIAMEKIQKVRKIKSYKYILENNPYLEYSQNNKEEIEHDTGEEKKALQNKKHFYPPKIPADKIMDAELCYKGPYTTRTELIPLLTCQGYENTARRKVLSSIMLRRKLTSTETAQKRIILNSLKNKNIARTAYEKETHGRTRELPSKTSPFSHRMRKVVDKVFSNSNSDSTIKKCVNNTTNKKETRNNSQIRGNRYLQPHGKEFKRNQSLSPWTRAEDKRINEAKLCVRNKEMDLIKQKSQTKYCSIIVDKMLPNSKLRFSNRPTIPLLPKSSKSFKSNPELIFKEMQIQRIKEARKRGNIFQPVLERNKALVDKTKPRIKSCFNNTESNREINIMRNSETIPLNPLFENYSHRENKNTPKYAPGRENIKSLFSIFDKKYSEPKYVKNTILHDKAENIVTGDPENSNDRSQIQLFEGIFSIEDNVSSQLNKTFSKDITKSSYQNRTDEEHGFYQQNDNPLPPNKEITIISSRNSLLDINDLHIADDFHKEETRTQSKDSLLSCGENYSKKLNTLENYIFQEDFFKEKQEGSLNNITGNTAAKSSLSTLGKSIHQGNHSLEDYDENGKISWNLNHMDVMSNSKREPQTISLLDYYLCRKINISRAENLHQEGHRLFSGNFRNIDRKSCTSTLEDAYFNFKYGFHQPKENTSADNSGNDKKYKISFTQEIIPDQLVEDKTVIITESVGGNNLEQNPETDKNMINFLTWKSYTLGRKDISRERVSNEFPQRETKIAYNVTPEANMLDVSNLNISECSSPVNKSINTAKFPYDHINFDFTIRGSKISQKLISYTPTQKNIAQDTLNSNSLLKEEGSSQMTSEIQEPSEKDKLQSKINTQGKYFFLKNKNDMKPYNTHFISNTNSLQFLGDKTENQSLFTTDIPTYKKPKENVPRSKGRETNIQESNLKFNNQLNLHLVQYAAIEETNQNSRIMRNNNCEVLSFNSNNSLTRTQTLKSYLLGAAISFQDYTNLLKKEMKDCRTVIKRNITNKV